MESTMERWMKDEMENTRERVMVTMEYKKGNGDNGNEKNKEKNKEKGDKYKGTHQGKVDDRDGKNRRERDNYDGKHIKTDRRLQWKVQEKKSIIAMKKITRNKKKKAIS